MKADFNKIEPMGTDKIIERGLKERKASAPIELEQPEYAKKETKLPRYIDNITLWEKVTLFTDNLFDGVKDIYSTVKKTISIVPELKQTLMWGGIIIGGIIIIFILTKVL